ncbi:DUF2254 domain-containing protein [Xanthobacter sp. KR7-225]|uniref:DUF2254 domain-containing protein n=1 Tax=Xanthobacter sp. KR7-225 TaxID=3156613 RepID=UPI0032B3783F
MSRWEWIFKNLARRLWVRASLIGLLGVAAAMVAAVAETYIPWQLPGSIGSDAVDGILNIIASSMLAVTTFSLSVMTSAYGSATSNVTPRATRLLMEDRVTQNVLSTFIGSFLFSIVGIVVLKTGVYGERGRVVLFVVTIGVIILIVVTLLRWIDHLTRLGRVGETTERVECATRAAIEARLAAPYLGGRPAAAPPFEPPARAVPVFAEVIGYVQHVDMGALQGCSERRDGCIHVAALPGSFVAARTPVAFIDSRFSDAGEIEHATEAVRRAFSLGSERNFDQDPRFGLAVLSEIACRALSPAVNDYGTAIDVIGRATRLLSLWAQGSTPPSDDDIRFPGVRVSPLRSDDLFEDAFMLIARDGAAMIEVQLRIQKVLAALCRVGDADFRAAARRQAELALLRADAALPIEADRVRLRATVEAGWGGLDVG